MAINMIRNQHPGGVESKRVDRWVPFMRHNSEATGGRIGVTLSGGGPAEIDEVPGNRWDS